MRFIAVLVVALVALVAAKVLLMKLPQPSTTTYAGTQSCKECHEKEVAAWLESHHYMAQLEPTADTVLGDFEDAAFSHEGVESRFTRRGDDYFITAEGPDGKPREFPVRYTFGWYPLQQYVVDLGNGRMQTPTVAWDSQKKRWFSIYDERIEPGDELHWCGPQFTWNHMCAECHTTGFRKNYDAKTDSYDTNWEEINVAFEACHGPSQDHVNWARDADRDESDPRLHTDPNGPAQIETCARCHSRRARLTGEDDHIGAFLDHYDPALLIEPLYFADGQIRDEVYVWGSFQQSKMHGAGVVCTDCHDAHTARLVKEGDALCAECHRTDPPERFPTLKKRAYDNFEHHGHQPGTEGAACVDCHMPATVYMGNDSRRDHSFRVPRPDLTIAVGVPNACGSCHLDRPPEWAVEAARSMGDGKVSETPHFATAFAAARNGDIRAAPDLIRILHGEAAPAIVRATAAQELSGFVTQDSLEALLDALEDKEPLVRAAAAEAIGRLPWVPQLMAEPLKRLWEDPVRVVRVSAAQAWRGDKPAPSKEVDERNDALADRAEGPYNSALGRARVGDQSGAEKGYRRAIDRDSNFLPARFNLANLLAAQGRVAEAEEQFGAILKSDPENGEAYYSLGLLVAEAGRMPDAAAALKEAARLLPGRARVRYNLGLALDRIERPTEAAAALEAAHRIAPRSPDFLHALVSHYAQAKDWDAAIRYAKALVTLNPDDRNARRLLAALVQESKR